MRTILLQPQYYNQLRRHVNVLYNCVLSDEGRVRGRASGAKGEWGEGRVGRRASEAKGEWGERRVGRRASGAKGE